MARLHLPGNGALSSSTELPIVDYGEGLSLEALGVNEPFRTILADPPWRFTNRTGKVAPEHKRLSRYDTMTLDDIKALPVSQLMANSAHAYLWVPNALLPEGLEVMSAWGFRYVSNIVWAKRRKDGGPDGRGVGFYFRNVTELLLFGVRGSMRTLSPGRSQVNMLETRKREHSRKPDEQYPLIEACSPGPRLELFARYPRDGWSAWGKEADEDITPRGKAQRGYAGHDMADIVVDLVGMVGNLDESIEREELEQHAHERLAAAARRSGLAPKVAEMMAREVWAELLSTITYESAATVDVEVLEAVS